MHEYYQIKKAALPILSTAGYEEVEEVQPDVYGSIDTLFSNGIRNIRLIWDGKEGCGLAQVFDGISWNSIEGRVPESSNELFASNIVKLCEKLKITLEKDKI
jgi:hypothetical protein